MALRIPGKGNFKPVRPLKSAGAASRRPRLLAKLAPRPRQDDADDGEVDDGVAEAGPSGASGSGGADETTEEGHDDASPARPPQHPTAATVTGSRKPLSKPLLAAVAAAGTARPRKSEPPKSQPHTAETPAPVPATQETEFEFEPTQRRRSPTPPGSTWAPPTVASAPPTVAPAPSSTSDSWNWMPPTLASVPDDFLPPTVAPAESWPYPPPPSVYPNDAPPAVAEVPPAIAPAQPAEVAQDTPTLAAALVASITPAEPSTRPKRARRAKKGKEPAEPAAEGDDGEAAAATPPPAKRPRRTTRAAATRASRAATETSDAGAGSQDGASEAGEDGEGARIRRSSRGPYNSRGKMGTPADKRTTVGRYPHRERNHVSHPELDGVQVNELVGTYVNPTVMRMGDLATTLVSQGRVSARTLKLHQFQRAEDERKKKESEAKREENWRRRQVVRRKYRAIKNEERARRREAASARGENPDEVVSDDSLYSDEEFDPMPDHLTPPGSPQDRRANRIIPRRVDEEENESEGREGTAPNARRAEDEEDVEGLGFITRPQEDDDVGSVVEDFQLPVDDDGEPATNGAANGEDTQDFSGLAYGDYTGGHLDEDGNWVESAPNAALLQQRQEEHRRRILEGDDNRQVEVIDNETQFVNSRTWGKKRSNERWTVEETELFFSVLRETGENYTIMKAYFPGRTVRQLKNKGLRENRVNPQRMTDAIMNRKPLDKEYLVKSAGFNNERPYDREMQFLDEVAREKERVIRLGTEALLEDGQEDGDDEDEQMFDAVEFGTV